MPAFAMVLAMKLRVLGCQGGSAPSRHLPGLLLDGTVLLEAGSVTSTLPLDEQLADAARARARTEGRPDMMDVLYLGLILGFLALSLGLVELCDRL
jgi:hypothetical protein